MSKELKEFIAAWNDYTIAYDKSKERLFTYWIPIGITLYGIGAVANFYINYKYNKLQIKNTTFINKYYMDYCKDDFFRAANLGNIESVKKYIKGGIDINICDKNGNNALVYASTNNKTEIVKELIKAGIDINSNNGCALRAVSQNGLDKIVEILLDSGAKVNCIDIDGRSALTESLCYKFDNINILNLLLKAGANMYHIDNEGNSVLMLAYQNENTQTVEIIKKAMLNDFSFLYPHLSFDITKHILDKYL